ncbi:hypothetical protein MNBD_CPR01-344 [hydrothermal vent metagenome]|uniref:Uncharacterized protein n=1 Tax=hydrothermal vent metagenome TaxID=652676 RepID=A0A3B0UNB9_9ZZZZ
MMMLCISIVFLLLKSVNNALLWFSGVIVVTIIWFIQESITTASAKSIEKKQSENKGKEFRVKDGTLQDLPERLIYQKQVSAYVFDPSSGKGKTLCVLSNKKDGVRIIFLKGKQCVPDKFAVLDKEVVIFNLHNAYINNNKRVLRNASNAGNSPSDN